MHADMEFIVQAAVDELWSSRGGVGAPPCARVVDCVVAEEGRLACAIAFDVAKRLDAAPREIADAILAGAHAALPRLEALLPLRIGGLGYLNATPTPEFNRAFIERLHRQGADHLFSRSPLVLGPAPVAAPEVPKFRIDARRVRAEAERSANEDLRELATSHPEFSKEDVLMALALLGDVELEARPYLQRLSGRQNVPWYLRRFFADVKRLEDQLSAAPERPRSGGLELQEIGLERAAVLLLSFREAVRRAVWQDAPQHVLAAALQLVQAFFFMFNHPQVRALSKSDAACSEAANQVAEITCVLSGVVRCALGSLEISCAV